MRRKNYWFCGVVLTLILCLSAFTGKASAAQKTVNHAEPLKVGEYMEPVENYYFEVRNEQYSVEYDKFILKVAPGVYVTPDFASVINTCMELVEEATGLSFYPDKAAVTGYDDITSKIEIRLDHRELVDGYAAVECASFSGCSFKEDGAAIGEFCNEYSTFVHELLHVIQIRNYGYLGDVITEGFAESYTGTIEKELRKIYGAEKIGNERENEIANIKNYGSWYYGTEYGLGWLDEEKCEKTFFLEPAHSGHETSYWIVEYIREKYGDRKFKKVMQALRNKDAEYAKTHTFLNLPNDLELEVLKATLSETFLSDFYTWLTTREYLAGTDYPYATVEDLTGDSMVEMGISYMMDYSLRLPGSFKYKDSIVFDFAKSVALLQQVFGARYKGLAISYYGVGIISFYDQYGTLLYQVGDSDYDYLSGSVKVPYATRILIEAPGENRFDIFLSYDEGCFDDTEFADITCKDGSIVTFAEFDKPEYEPYYLDPGQKYLGNGVIMSDPSAVTGDGSDDGNSVSGTETAPVKEAKPVKKSVKTFKALREALAEAEYVGGKITVVSNITVTEWTVVPENVELVVKKGKKLTLKGYGCLDIAGTLTNKDKGIVFKDGWIWLQENATWNNGSVTYSSKVRKDFPEDTEYSCGIKFTKETGSSKLCVWYGLYNRLYVTAGKGTKLDKLVEFAELRDGFTVYFNKKKVSAKTIKKLTIVGY